MNSSIENTRSENILGYMYPSIDETGGGLYKTFDSINDINANAKGIYNYHFIKIEEQLDQIINNTAINGLDLINAVGSLVGMGVLPAINFRKNNNTGGKGGGLKVSGGWLTDSDKIDEIAETISKIGIGSIFFNSAGVVGEGVDPQTVNGIQSSGSWLKDKGSEIWEAYLDKYSMNPEDFDSMTGASGFFRKGSVERTKLDEFNDEFNENRKEMERALLGEYLNSFQKYPIEVYPLLRIQSTFTSAMANIASNYVDFGGSRRSRHIGWSEEDEETESKRGLKIFSGPGLWPAVQALLLPFTVNAEKNAVPGSDEYVVHTRSVEVPNNLAAPTNNIAGYHQDVASANALGNGNIYSNGQTDLLKDESSKNYNEIATQNNNSTVANNPTIINHFNIEVKEKVDDKNFFQNLKTYVETEMASVMDYSGMTTGKA